MGKASTATVGVADHAGWAVLMTVTDDGTPLDRRRVALVDDALPKLPYHHNAQGLPLPQAEALIRRVQAAAEQHAGDALEALAKAVSQAITAVALRECPPLPDTIAERLTDYRAQNVADTVMIRQALADAATARGWAVYWYAPKHVFAQAAAVLHRDTLDDLLKETGAALGPPWQKDHRMAMAAAIAAAGVNS